MVLTLYSSCFLLPSQSILIQELVNRSVSCQFFAFLVNLRLKMLNFNHVAIVFVLFVLQGIEPIENCPLFFFLFVATIGLGMESAFALFLSLQILFEHLFFLLYFFSEVLLLLKKLLKCSRSSLARCFGFECALSIYLSLLFLLELPNLSILFCEALADLLANGMLFLLEDLDPSLLS